MIGSNKLKNSYEYDVIVVGYGPVGRLLALKLGKRGHKVLVVERQKATYFLPRAVHIDDEACRILQSVGAGPDRMPAAIGPYDDYYEWRNADQETILRLDWRGLGPSGWNVSNFFNQPLLEKHLHGLVEDQPTVDVEYATTVTSIDDLGDHVQVRMSGAKGSERIVTGAYLVGADGARSMVREWIGGPTTDLGYFHAWLVVDLIMKHDRMSFDPPAWQLCDPARPTTLVPGGPGRRRFEFMLLPGETPDGFSSEATTWDLLAPWGIGPEDAELERHTVYTFQARWADEWRRGRVLIAGDAAHLMPPFAGQGMCSGLRDAVNLEWKLHLVLQQLANDDLLDTYGPERKEHVRHFIAASMALGEVICITDPDRAAERDDAMRSDLASGAEQPARPLPRLGDGAFDPSSSGGLLSIQTMVRGENGVARFDDVVLHDGYLLFDSIETLGEVDGDRRRALVERGIALIAVGGEPASETIVDVERGLASWFDELNASAVLVRPDFYIFGTAHGASDVPDLIDRYLASCGAPISV